MPQPRRAPAHLVDPAAAGGVALLVYSLHGFHASLGQDQGTFVYAGQQVARGVPPFVGIFNSVGPLGDLVTGAGVRVGSLVGLDDVLAARLTYLAASVAVVVVLSVLARTAFRSRVAGLLAPAVFLTFASFLKLATGGPREKTVMLVCLELALLLMLRRRWYWAGFLTALATLTWQPAFLSAVAAAAVAMVTSDGSGRARAAATYAVGGLTPTAVTALAYLVAGHLRMAWWGFVVINVGYTSQPSILDSWRLVTADYRWSTVLVVGGWLAMLGLGAAAFRRARTGTRSSGDRALQVLAAGALIAGAWSCYAINGGADLFVVLPYAALGIGGGLDLALRGLSVTAARRGAALVGVLAVLAAGAEALDTRDGRLTAERRDTAAMAAVLPAGSTVMSVNAPEVLVLLERRNPGPWQLSTSATVPFMEAHLPGGLEGYARRVRALRPALIAVGRHSDDTWLLGVLSADYERVGSGDHWAWYASRRLDPGVRARLRAANAASWD